MDVLNKLEGKPDDTDNLNDNKGKEEAGVSTDIDTYGRLNRITDTFEFTGMREMPLTKTNAINCTAG